MSGDSAPVLKLVEATVDSVLFLGSIILYLVSIEVSDVQLFIVVIYIVIRKLTALLRAHLGSPITNRIYGLDNIIIECEMTNSLLVGVG